MSISIDKASYFGLYTGTTKDGKRHGKGILELSNQDTLKGDWDDGDFSGFGTIEWATKKVSYKGQVKDFQPNGEGVMVDSAK